MSFTFLDFLSLFGALGFFIYGMKVMSEGIQRTAGSKLREILKSMAQNKYMGIFTGFLVTCLVQSSSASTVMVVSFANAGMLTLIESIGVIMGANIGTTITAWLIAIFGFKIEIISFALPIIAIAFPLMFSNKAYLRSTADVLIGFALLFLGLDALKNTVPNLNQNPEVLDFLANFTDYGIFTTLLFVGIGTLITILVQSSSAAIALTLTLLFNDIITFEIAAAMVLGENVGTTITANLAALVGNVHAKRAARAHLVFNLIGVSWMIILFPYFIDFIHFLWDPFQNMLQQSIPDIGQSDSELKLTLFHTIFNILNVLLMIGFIPAISRLVTKIVPSKDGDDENFSLEYISSTSLLNTEASILGSKKELAAFGRLIKKMSACIPELMLEMDQKKFKRLYKQIERYEDRIDQTESEIVAFLAKVSEGELNEQNSTHIRAMLSIADDLETIGDINYSMARTIKRKTKNKIYFIPKQRQNILQMFNLLEAALENMQETLNQEFSQVNLENAIKNEKAINKMRNSLKKKHLKSIEKGDYKYESGMIYTDLFSAIEQVGDHVISVCKAASGEIN